MQYKAKSIDFSSLKWFEWFLWIIGHLSTFINDNCPVLLSLCCDAPYRCCLQVVLLFVLLSSHIFHSRTCSYVLLLPCPTLPCSYVLLLPCPVLTYSILFQVRMSYSCLVLLFHVSMSYSCLVQSSLIPFSSMFVFPTPALSCPVLSSRNEAL